MEKTLTYLLIIAFCTISLRLASAAKESDASDGEKDKQRIMYSYSEAVVGEDGNPAVTQLTIAKANDGHYNYVETHPNGTVRTGRWDGPLPSTPQVKQLELLEQKMNNMTNDVTSNLTKLNESIGTKMQDYLQKVLKTA